MPSELRAVLEGASSLAAGTGGAGQREAKAGMGMRAGGRVRAGGQGPRARAAVQRRGWPPVAQPASRRRTLVRALVFVVLTLVALGAAAFGGLLVITPSVGNARSLARAQDRAHHVVYPGPQVPYRFAAALEATEDHRFRQEPGIDPIAIGRVILAKLGGRGDQGGATLYQQLAKLLYTPGRSGLLAKAEQVALAVKLKFSYSGQQILRMYAGVAYFGHGFYGLSAASCGYFGVTPRRMSWPQAALLAGLVLGPSADDPLRFPAEARAREMHVIGRLVATGALNPAQASRLREMPLRRLLARAGQSCRR